MIPDQRVILPLASTPDALSPAARGAAPDDIRRARACIVDLTRRLEGRQGVALRAELNDAYLRMQFAVVTGQAGRVRTEVRALARLVREAREATPAA